MVNRIFCDGNLNRLKKNQEYIKTISTLEQDNKEYIIGLDLAAVGYPDKSVMCWFSKNKDGTLTYEAYKYIEIDDRT